MRYKEFNPNSVLEKCIPLFWLNGFNATSIADIVNKTGVNRFSLYQEFDDKEGVLYKSLELYYERYTTQNFKLLKQNKPLKIRLNEFYMSFLEDSDSHPSGSYLIHVANDIADRNEKVKNMLDAFLNELNEAFSNLLLKEFESTAQIEMVANQLVALYCNAMCFCVIQTYDEREALVDNGLNIIFDKIK